MRRIMLSNLLVKCFVLLVVFNVGDSGKKRGLNRRRFVTRSRYVVERRKDSSSSISYSLNPSFRKPTYMRYVNSIKHTPGKDVILVCMTTGVKPITYSWLYNGQIIQEKKRLKFIEDRSILKIKRVRDTDAGVYMCTAKNAYGSLSFNFNIKLKAKQKKPSFYDHVMMQRKQSAIRPIRQSIRFECQADGEGVIHYIWMKNGKPFKHIEHSRTLKGVKHESSMGVKQENKLSGDLVLKNLKIHDGGLYTCMAINKYGNVSFVYELKILRKLTGGPPIVIPYTRPQELHVPTGTNVTLDCLEIISATIPDVRWFHLYDENDHKRALPDMPDSINWNDINSPDHPFIAEYISARYYTNFQVKRTRDKSVNKYVYDDTDPSGLRLNLVNVTTQDTGAYTCYVSNLEGSDYAIFYLVVEGQSNE